MGIDGKDTIMDISNYKNAFLVNTRSDIKLINELFSEEKNLFICHNFELYNSINISNKVYFYKESDGKSKLFNLVHKVASNWFVDDKKNDLFFDLSYLGLPLFSRIQSELSNYVREYFSIVEWLNVAENFVISNKENEVIVNILRILKVQYSFYKSDSNSDRISIVKRAEISCFPKIHTLSKFAILLQKFIRINKNMKFHLLVPDWTYNNIIKQNKNTLFYNRLNPKRGYYLSNKKRYIVKYEALFNKALIDKSNIEDKIMNIHEVNLSSHKRNLSKLFADTIFNQIIK